MRSAQSLFIRFVLFAAFVSYMGSGCTEIKKMVKTIPPGTVSISLPPDLADLVRRVAIHDSIEAITLSRWGTIFLVAPDKISEFLRCHELEHNIQFAEYDNDIDAIEAYAGEFLRSTVTVAIVRGRTEYLILVPQILAGKVDPKTLLRDEATALLKAGYTNHSWELAADETCKHLR